MEDKAKDLEQLGNQKTVYPQSPDEAKLEVFKNTAGDILIPFMCNEFTSLCPKTGQPDFAKMEILYVPDELCVESKALKLYLFSFRNHGDFHEDVTNRIMQDLIRELNPKFIRVFGDFNVRGGISIKPLAMYYRPDVLSNTVLKEHIDGMITQWGKVRHFDYQV
jgi:7-cyano-7-deazaguanine reductase